MLEELDEKAVLAFGPEEQPERFQVSVEIPEHMKAKVVFWQMDEKGDLKEEKDFWIGLQHRFVLAN